MPDFSRYEFIQISRQGPILILTLWASSFPPSAEPRESTKI